jgi:hypothetical protein
MKYLFLLIAFMVSCGPVKINEPVRWDGEPMKCFRERYCRYQEQNNPDKSSCQSWADECSKLIDFEYCKDEKNRVPVKVKDRHGNIHEGTDFHVGCWDILK